MESKTKKIIIISIILIVTWVAITFYAYRIMKRSIGENQQPTIVPQENICPESASRDGITYGIVKAKDGRCWLDRNLGAKRVAASATDEESYGWYFQWGRNADGHQLPNSEITIERSNTDNPGHAKFISTSSSIVLFDWRSDNNTNRWNIGANNPCPNGFRLPTNSEWASLLSNESITNSASAFNSTLKLPLAGNRQYLYPSKVDYQAIGGSYWSSTPNNDLIGTASYMGFNSSMTDTKGIIARLSGLSVRCIYNKNFRSNDATKNISD